MKVRHRPNPNQAKGAYRENGIEGETDEANTIPFQDLGSGHLSCYKCGCNFFAVIKADTTVSIGCKECGWDARFEVPPKSSLVTLS